MNTRAKSITFSFQRVGKAKKLPHLLGGRERGAAPAGSCRSARVPGQPGSRARCSPPRCQHSPCWPPTVPSGASGWWLPRAYEMFLTRKDFRPGAWRKVSHQHRQKSHSLLFLSCSDRKKSRWRQRHVTSVWAGDPR